MPSVLVAPYHDHRSRAGRHPRACLTSRHGKTLIGSGGWIELQVCNPSSRCLGRFLAPRENPAEIPGLTSNLTRGVCVCVCVCVAQVTPAVTRATLNAEDLGGWGPCSRRMIVEPLNPTRDLWAFPTPPVVNEFGGLVGVRQSAASCGRDFSRARWACGQGVLRPAN